MHVCGAVCEIDAGNEHHQRVIMQRFLALSRSPSLSISLSIGSLRIIMLKKKTKTHTHICPDKRCYIDAEKEFLFLLASLFCFGWFWVKAHPPHQEGHN